MCLRENTKQYLLNLDNLYNKSGNINSNIKKMLSDSVIKDIEKLYTNVSLGIAVYCIINDVLQPLCKICGSTVYYYNKQKNQFASCCSIKCSRQDPLSITKRKQTKLDKYGHQGFNNRQLAKKTNIKKYGSEFPTQNTAVKNKIKETLVEKSEELKQTRHNTFVEKYGAHPQKTDAVKQKKKNNTLEKYGVEHTTQLPEIVDKIQKHKKTFYQEKYQWVIDYILKLPEARLRTEIAQETGISLNVITSLIKQYNLPHVKVEQGSSAGEKELSAFLEDHDIEFETKNRSLLNGKEIDIYIPSSNLAIEFNGVYWHSEEYGKDDSYHLEKTTLCESKGIQLLHIWDTEWKDTAKKDIWKSMILSRLGKNRKIYARNCVVKTVSTKDARTFLDNNHLQGFAGGETKLGLYHNNTLVQLIIVGKSRYNNNVDRELIRSASKKYMNVVGGLSKLLKHVNCKIISYADRRYSVGNSYEKVDFTRHSTTKPNYYYVVNGILESRIKYQKHKLNKKLKKFNQSLSEVENMHLNNHYRIWDCGHLVYVYNE